MLLPYIIFNMLLGVINLAMFYKLRSVGQSGIFAASVAMFNFSTAAFIAYIAHIN